MATQASLDQIQNLYIAFYGRPADLAGQTYWADELEAANGDLTAIIDAFASSEEYDSQYGDLTNEELVNALYQQILGRDAEQAGLDFYVGELEAGNITEGGIALAILNGASGDDATTMANRKAVADEFTAAVEAGDKEYGDAQLASAKALLAGVDAETDPADVDVAAVVDAFPEAEEPVEPGTPGEEFFLTASTDVMTGTEDDDSFMAYMSQNELAGGVSNTLSSADRIDGGEGNDSLYAELVPEFFGTSGDNQIDVQPRINNVETIELEARDLGGNTDLEEDGLLQQVTFDAKYVTDIDNIGSKFSDGDLIIENLTTLTSDGVARNTADITITMDHTDNFNSDDDASDLTVYFDEDYLLAGQSTTTSQANYWLLDEDSEDYETAPLLNIERDGVTLTIDGTPVEIRMETEVAAAADTWEAFAAGLQAAIDQLVADGATILEDISVIVDEDNTDETYNDFGALVTIPAITLIDAQGRDLTPTGFTSPEEATGAFDIYGDFNSVESQQLDQPVTVNVDLHKVGREGKGGELVIGGKSQSEEGEGIEVFNIDVLGADNKPSYLGQVRSTNNALETINIATASEYASGDSFASLTIEGNAQPLGGTVDMINAASFLGDLTIGNATNGAEDVNTLNATGGGDVEFHAEITGDEAGVFSYTTGAGEDTVRVDLDGDAVDTIGTSLTVNTGDNDDAVNVTMDQGVSQNTMADLENLTINTGAGDDEVNLDAYGNFQINTSAGDDFVRINSEDENGNGTTGAWAFGQASGDQDFTARVLYSAELTVSFAGIEETVTIETDAAGNFIATQAEINAAIEEAIEGNAALNQLLTVTYGTGNQQLNVVSNIAGDNTLAVAIYQPELVASAPAAGQVILSSDDVTEVRQGLINTTNLDSEDLNGADVAAFIAQFDDEAYTNFAGSIGSDAQGDGANYQYNENDVVVNNAGINDTGNDIFDVAGNLYQDYNNGGSSDSLTGINFSTIDLGRGDDLVVLHSREDSANVVKIDGEFDSATIVNFHNVSTDSVDTYTEVGNHALEFTFLDNQIDPSDNNNDQSVVDLAVTVNVVDGAESFADSPANPDVTNTNNAEANSVNLIRFEQAANEAFADLDADTLVTALNGDGNYGNLTGALLTPVLNNELVGTTQKHIIMVENDLNEGEYKVFEVTSTINDAGDAIVDGDFTTANEIGTLDFGASVNLNVVGSTAWETLVGNLMDEHNEIGNGVDVAGPVTVAGYPDADLGDLDYAIADTLANILTENNGGSATLAGAETIQLTDVNNEEITLTGLADNEAGSTIDFVDNAASLTQTQLVAIESDANVSDTDADALSVSAVTVAAGDFAEADAIDLLDNNDTIAFDGGAATLAAANYKAVFETAGVSATSGDEITVNTLDSATVAGTAANDNFALLNTDTGVTINDFVSANDTVQLGGTDAAVALAVADIDGSETLIFDTAANLGANAVNIDDQSGGSAVNWAVASDTGVVYYDADGNWTAGVVTVGTVNADALVAGDFLVG